MYLTKRFLFRGHIQSGIRPDLFRFLPRDIQSRTPSKYVGTRVVWSRRRTQAIIWFREQHEREEWKKCASSTPLNFYIIRLFRYKTFGFRKFLIFFLAFLHDPSSAVARARVRWRISFEKCLFEFRGQLKSLCAQTFINKPNSSAKLQVERRGSWTNAVPRIISPGWFFFAHTKIVIFPLHSRRRERNQQIPYRSYCEPGKRKVHGWLRSFSRTFVSTAQSHKHRKQSKRKQRCYFINVTKTLGQSRHDSSNT